MLQLGSISSHAALNNNVVNEARRDDDPAAYSIGEHVQIWSNGQKQWLAGVVEAVFMEATMAEGFAVPPGTVKVVSAHGVKWVRCENILATLRKVGHPKDSSSEPPPPLPTGGVSAEILCGDSRHLCKAGCGRVVQPGLTRGLKAYDTCCKRCATNPGTGQHDENCGGQMIVRRTTQPGRKVSYKASLDSALQDKGRLEDHVRSLFLRMTERERTKDRLRDRQIEEALHEFLVPYIGILHIEVNKEELQGLVLAHSSSKDGSLTYSDFLAFCSYFLSSLRETWFPDILPVSTSSFVRRNPRLLADVYRIGEKLGEGSFGVVHRAHHKVSGEQRVCKTISINKSKMTLEQILPEIGNMAMLDHPNVLKVYEYFADKTSVSQILEVCSGGELQDKIEVFKKTGQPGYDEAFICDVMKQTLRALAFMHSLRFLHKDLKPQNIMMVDKESSSIKIIDFGLAELLRTNEEFAASVGGTLLYMAPEVFVKRMTVKVDIWSAGVILYNLLTADFPFLAQWPVPPGRDEQWWQIETTKKIREEELHSHPRLQSASPSCLDLLRQMLCKDESLRPDAAQCLEHAWFRGFSEIPPTLSVGVVQCVEAYGVYMSQLKKAIFLLIAHQFEVPALLELRSLFTYFDVTNQGRLIAADLKAVLMASGMGELTAERVTYELDRNADGCISWLEFTAAAICVSVCRNTRIVDAAFATFDSDQDGIISAADVEALLLGTGSDGASAKSWQNKIPLLFAEITESVTSTKGSETLGFRAAPQDLRFQAATKEQFRAYLGRQVGVRAGNALFAVTG